MALGLVGKLTVMFGADFKGFDKSIRNATNKLDKFSKKAGRIGSQMTTNLSLPILALGAGAVKLASDFEESLNKVNVSFGESSKEVQSFAKTTLNSFGIAEGSALEMAALFGDMGTSMGLTQKQAAGMSTSLVGLAGDLSSFKNIRIDVAQTALASIFTGETESLKKLGVVMTEANLKQFALEQGITKTIKQMSQAEKVQLRYNFVISQSTNAIGDFARTSDGVANSTRSLQESVKELGEQFGKELLPIASDLINSLSSLVKTLSNMSDENKKLLIDVGLLTAVIGPFITGLASLSTLLKNLITFLPKLIKLITGPLGLAVAFVTAFIKMDEGDGILINLKKRFNELKTAIFGVNEEAKKLDFSIQDLPLDPEEIRKRMLEGKIPFIKTTKKKKTTKTDSKNTNDLSNLKNTTDAANELSLTLQELEQFKPLENMSSISDQFAVEMSLVNEQFEDIVVNLEVFNSKLRESNALNQLFGDVLYDSMLSAANSQESFFSSFIQNIKKAIKQLIIQLAVLTAINILLGGPGVAGNLAKAFTLAKNSILGLANGGLVTGPTMALVGEGAGTTASNPEVVAPLDKLKGMINGGGTQQVEVYGRISGNDIFISNQRGGLNRQRAV
tara:strand:+ start:317 stop:2173 length:1857 start_codon:yes stop_codon:yes gene_type:complete